MQVAPGITLRGVEMTPAIDDLFAKGLDRLEQVCKNIVSVRIALEQAQGRRQQGNAYHMRIDIRIPGAEVVVKRESKAVRPKPDGAGELQAEDALKSEQEAEEPRLIGRSPVSRTFRDEPVAALIRRTFDSAQRELKKIVDHQRGEVKTPAQAPSAVVERIFRERGYGFLRTLEGEEVYFHQNSVLHDHWDKLKVGTAVRFAAETGEKGLQASTVEPVERPGVAEAHDELHELPVVAAPRAPRKKR